MLTRIPVQPKFTGLVCHNEGERRCPETGVRIFKYELTNNTEKYPLDSVVCPQSKISKKSHPAVGALSKKLPLLKTLSKEARLEEVKALIRQDAHNWDIGKNKPDDLKPECLADRGERLLQQSTADIIEHPDGTLSLIMDYDLDLKGISLTALLNNNNTDKRPRLEVLA